MYGNKPLKIEWPLDFHPGTSKYAPVDEGLASLAEASATINSALGSVRDHTKLASAVRTKSAAALRTAQQRFKEAQSDSQNTSTKISEIVNKHRPEFAQEVRAHVATSKSPTDAVRKMVLAGDTESVGAVLRAPAFLSGLTDEQQFILRNFAKSRFCPELGQREAEIDKGIALLERAISRFSEETTRLDRRLGSTDEAIIAKLKEGVA